MPESQSLSAPDLAFSRRQAGLVACVLLVILALLLFNSARQESQTFDESTHLGAGFWYWKHGDFARNPEHPPLVKMLAALPLLPMGLKEPPPSHIPYFKGQDTTYGTQFLYSADGDASKALLSGRMVIMAFSLGLGILLFFATQELFGPLSAIFALCLYVFQPLLLGNGNIVTTDMALAFFLFASVYTFYRFCSLPSILRFALCAVATSLAIVSKHSGILVLPLLCLLAASDAFLPDTEGRASRRSQHQTRWIVLALCGLILIGYVGIWAIYGFRYGQLHINPPIAVYAADIARPTQAKIILFLARHRIFPEPYLYGWVDILRIPSTRPSFLLGHIYPTSRWFFFPVAFLIKSTVALLVFLLVLPFVRPSGHLRQLVFFAIPPAFLLVVSMASMLNGGTRYLIPLYPYCLALAGTAAAALFQRGKVLGYAVAAVLVFGVASTLHSWPNFLAYSNELFGGPAHTYRYLTDPDADWGQGLKWTRTYLDQHPGSSNCWFDYYGNPGVDPAKFDIRCKPLLTSFQHLIGVGTPPIPTTISGTILVSTSDLDGVWWGPGALNPYQQFQNRAPDATIGNIILVYHGTFHVPLLAAETNAVAATGLLHQGRVPEALTFARTAVEQAPAAADVQATLGQILMASGHVSEGRQTMATALHLAQNSYPEYQKYLIDQIQHPAPHP